MQIAFCIDFLMYTVQSDHGRILLDLNAERGLWFISTAYFTANYFENLAPDALCVINNTREFLLSQL